MRVLVSFFLGLLLSAAAFAADLQIRVVDPRSAAVAGAQVSLLSSATQAPVKFAVSSAEGQVSFANVPAGSYELRVLAPGFAPQTLSVQGTSAEPVTVRLRVATATETVVVSATRTPVSAEETATSISTLEQPELEAMQPIAESDALRFLPGAVVSAAGQRGALTTLFVRGGDSVYNKVIIDGVPVTEPGGTFDFGTVPLAEADRLEFLRGAQSTLYGSDAMTSVVQVFTRTGTARVPELRFGAMVETSLAPTDTHRSPAHAVSGITTSLPTSSTRRDLASTMITRILCRAAMPVFALVTPFCSAFACATPTVALESPANGTSIAPRCWPLTSMPGRARTICSAAPNSASLRPRIGSIERKVSNTITGD
jgi:Outer membrane cobalamin receptor protein